MSSSFGNKLKVSIFGQSHSPGIGVVVDGLPAGVEIDMDKLHGFLERRTSRDSEISTSRKEKDEPVFFSGFGPGERPITCGAPIGVIIENKDVKSQDYDVIKVSPRPGHADYTAHIKYDGFEDYRGGGHFSGRITAALCVAGGLSLQVLETLGISVESRILEVGGCEISPGPEGEEIMKNTILEAKKDGDSVGGIVECSIHGVPVGVGEPIFDGFENRIAQAVFGIPAIKGIEFGSGFGAARMRGSENNDALGKYSDTNNAGGILGGIANGEDIVFRVAVKPTPSIAKEQRTIDYETGESVTISVNGRHDPCIVPRVLPCVESAAAIAVLDLML